MAQYLPFIPDTFPEPVVYSPDFNFFDKMLQRKQAQYEQGVSQAKFAYKSVADVALSDKANIPLRDQYLKQAQEGLKKIASTDLSLPENQQLAQRLYAPFWEDSFMAKDAALTKWYQSQAQKLDSWRTSSDPKIREQYSGIVTQYLSNGIDVLRNANRSYDAYSKVEKREAIPWVNLEKYLEDAATAAKLSIKYDDPSGPYLVSIENGERSKDKFAAWAASKIGNNFYQQFNVSGIVEKEQRIKNIKKDPQFLRMHPSATDEEVLAFMADDVISELKQGYNKRKEEANVELARINGLINAMPDILDAEHQKMLKSLKDQKIGLLGKLAGIDKEYENFNKPNNTDLIRNNLLINPDSYFATLAKQQVINNWATGRASIESRTIKENEGWSAAENLEMRKKEYDLAERKENRERDQQLWERTHPKNSIRTKTVKDANGNDVTVIDDSPYTDEESTGSYIGPGTTDITKTEKTGVALDVFNNNQKTLFNTAYDMLFDPTGILSFTKKEFGMTQDELSQIYSFFKREMRSNVYDINGADVSQTKEEKAAIGNLIDKLLTNDSVKKAGFSKKEDFTGPGTLANALEVFADDYLFKRNSAIKEGKEPPLTDDEFAAALSYTVAHANLQLYFANEENRKKLFKDNILNNPAYKNLVKDGHLVTVDDIENDIIKNYGNIEIELTNEKGNKIVKTNRDIAKSFFNGDFNVNNGKFSSSIYKEGFPTKIKVNGKNVELPSHNPLKSSYWVNTINFWVEPIYDILSKQYGESKEFLNLMKKAENEIVPNLLFYQSKTGKLGSNWAYNFSRNKENDKAYQLFNTALSASSGMIYDKNNENPVDPEISEKIREIFANKEKTIEDRIGGFTYKSLTAVDGKPAVQFTISSSKDEKKDPINAIAGTYNIVIENIDNQLNSLPQNTGHYFFEDLLRGKIIKSNPVMAASGFNYEITPDDRRGDRPTKAYVTLNYLERQNKIDENGVLQSTLVPKSLNETFNLTEGENRKTPDEIVFYLNNLYQSVMLSNKQAQDEYQLYLKNKNGSATSPVRTITKAEMMKQLNLTAN